MIVYQMLMIGVVGLGTADMQSVVKQSESIFETHKECQEMADRVATLFKEKYPDPDKHMINICFETYYKDPNPKVGI